MSRFLRDVRDGNLAAVQRHLTSSPSAARATEPGTERTPLHIAAANSHADVVRELLSVNAPHDAKDQAGNVPLHTAVQTGDARTVAELLGRGAKIEVKAKNNLGATPLHLAAKLGHIRIARELLAVGARADAKDQRGRMPMEVVPRGNDELVELLKEAGGDSKLSASPVPNYSRPTSASSAAGRTTPAPTPTRLAVSSPPSSATPVRRSVTSTLPRRASTGYAGSVIGSEVVADQIEKQGAVQRGQEKTLQQLNAKVDNMEGVVDQQRQLIAQQANAMAEQSKAFAVLQARMAEQSGMMHEVGALRMDVESVSVLRAAQSQQSEALQTVQSTVFKRFELLASDVRNQIGKIDRRLLSTENGGATHLGAVDALQLQMESIEERLADTDRQSSAGAPSAALPNVIRKVEAMERRIIANEKQRQMERQRDLNAAQAASENGANGDVSDVEPSSASMTRFSDSGENNRAIKKQSEIIGSLQKSLASLESRLVDYQDAVAVQMAGESESPDYMTSLRSAMEAAASEAGSGVSGDSSAVPRSNGEQSSAAMTAVLIALEGLTKEVARVRVRTAQLGDRNHTSDVRLTYVEDQTTRIKNKLKQLKGWFTLTDSGNTSGQQQQQHTGGSSRGTSSSKQRGALFTDASGGRLSERNVHNRNGSSGSLYSSSRNSLARSQSLTSSAIVRPITFD